MKRIGAMLCAASLVIGVGLVTSAPAASAASRDGRCDSGEFCYYFNSNQQGATSDHTGSIPDLGTGSNCYVFRTGTTGSNGSGLCAKNNAASVFNRSSKPVTVYFNSGYAGRSQTIGAGQKANLVTGLKNENASHRFGSAPAGAWASPVPSSARITGTFPNYSGSGKYHGAVDYAGFTGKFRSACTGTIDSVAINATYANRNAYGVSGSTNYLWVNCGGGIRMGYAHFYQRDLPSWAKAGTRVTAGQQLVTVGNQGNSSGTHLHFEVRSNGTVINGQQFLKGKGVTGLPSGSGQTT